jgi:hypothetical protein
MARKKCSAEQVVVLILIEVRHVVDVTARDEQEPSEAIGNSDAFASLPTSTQRFNLLDHITKNHAPLTLHDRPERVSRPHGMQFLLEFDFRYCRLCEEHGWRDCLQQPVTLVHVQAGARTWIRRQHRVQLDDGSVV